MSNFMSHVLANAKGWMMIWSFGILGISASSFSHSVCDHEYKELKAKLNVNVENAALLEEIYSNDFFNFPELTSEGFRRYSREIIFR